MVGRAEPSKSQSPPLCTIRSTIKRLENIPEASQRWMNCVQADAKACTRRTIRCSVHSDVELWKQIRKPFVSAAVAAVLVVDLGDLCGSVVVVRVVVLLMLKAWGVSRGCEQDSRRKNGKVVGDDDACANVQIGWQLLVWCATNLRRTLSAHWTPEFKSASGSAWEFGKDLH